MSEQASATTAPTNAPAAPTEPITAGGSFAEFQQQVQERMKARAAEPRLDQPPPVKKTVQPLPDKQPLVEPPAETPPQETISKDPEQPTETPPEQQQQQLSPEDMELFAKFKEWMQGDILPDEFSKKLIALKNGDEIEYETLEEVRAGRMRQRDYTREMQKFDRDREAWEGERQHYKAHFDAIFSDEKDGEAGGKAMYDIYTTAGKRKQLLALGAMLAREEQEDIDAANGFGLALMRREGIQNPQDHRVQSAIKQEWERRQAARDSSARMRALEFENQQLKRQTEQKQQQTHDAEYAATQKRQLDQLRPRAFEALGLNHDDPVHRDQFDQYFAAIFRQERATKVTPEIVMKATRAAKEALDEFRKTHANGSPAKPQPKPFQPQLQAGGGKVPGSKPQQWHAESFAEKFKLPRW